MRFKIIISMLVVISVIVYGEIVLKPKEKKRIESIKSNGSLIKEYQKIDKATIEVNNAIINRKISELAQGRPQYISLDQFLKMGQEK